MPIEIIDPKLQLTFLNLIREVFANDFSALTLEDQIAPTFEATIKLQLPPGDNNLIFSFEFEAEGSERKLFFYDFNQDVDRLEVTEENFPPILQQIWGGNCYLKRQEGYVPFQAIVSPELEELLKKMALVEQSISKFNKPIIPLIKEYLLEDELIEAVKNQGFFKENTTPALPNNNEPQKQLKSLTLI